MDGGGCCATEWRRRAVLDCVRWGRRTIRHRRLWPIDPEAFRDCARTLLDQKARVGSDRREHPCCGGEIRHFQGELVRRQAHGVYRRREVVPATGQDGDESTYRRGSSGSTHRDLRSGRPGCDRSNLRRDHHGGGGGSTLLCRSRSEPSGVACRCSWPTTSSARLLQESWP